MTLELYAGKMANQNASNGTIKCKQLKPCPLPFMCLSPSHSFLKHYH